MQLEPMQPNEQPKPLILIAESGSTKCDWIAVERSRKEYIRFSSMGFNPYFHSSSFIEQTLRENPDVGEWSKRVEKIFFYGAGCSSPKLNRIVLEGLRPVFSSAEIEVDHDLYSAAYATYRGVPEIACILGTGSNSVYFDGCTLREEVPALAYILGDEGSASWLGKRLLSQFLYKKLPAPLEQALKDDFELTKERIVEAVYNRPNANVWLASFSRLLGQHADLPWVESTVLEGFRLFRDIHVLCYPEARAVEVNFVGSVAWHFKGILETVLAEEGLRLGQVVARPLDGLVDFHFAHKQIGELGTQGAPQTEARL